MTPPPMFSVSSAVTIAGLCVMSVSFSLPPPSVMSVVASPSGPTPAMLIQKFDATPGIAATIGVGGAIITESTLSFLGLGFPSDTPTLGRILFDAVNYLDFAPHWAFFPGLAIFLIVLAINFIGDGLRDALDPRRKI